MPLKSIPAHGRAFVFLTAIGGGLAVEVKLSLSRFPFPLASVVFSDSRL